MFNSSTLTVNIKADKDTDENWRNPQLTAPKSTTTLSSLELKRRDEKRAVEKWVNVFGVTRAQYIVKKDYSAPLQY